MTPERNHAQSKFCSDPNFRNPIFWCSQSAEASRESRTRPSLPHPLPNRKAPRRAHPRPLYRRPRQARGQREPSASRHHPSPQRPHPPLGRADAQQWPQRARYCAHPLWLARFLHVAGPRRPDFSQPRARCARPQKPQTLAQGAGGRSSGAVGKLQRFA